MNPLTRCDAVQFEGKHDTSRDLDLTRLKKRVVHRIEYFLVFNQLINVKLAENVGLINDLHGQELHLNELQRSRDVQDPRYIIILQS